MLLVFDAMLKRIRYRDCRVCGARYPFVSISSRGLCVEHGRARMTRNVIALKTRSGPDWERWQRGMARAGGVIKREPLEAVTP